MGFSFPLLTLHLLWHAPSAHFSSRRGLTFPRHEPRRGIGGVADKREAFARWAELPGGGNSVNITEEVRKYAAEQAISEKTALQAGMEEISHRFAAKSAQLYSPS